MLFTQLQNSLCGVALHRPCQSPNRHGLVQQAAELKIFLNIKERHTYINNRLKNTYFLHLLHTQSS